MLSGFSVAFHRWPAARRAMEDRELWERALARAAPPFEAHDFPVLDLVPDFLFFFDMPYIYSMLATASMLGRAAGGCYAGSSSSHSWHTQARCAGIGGGNA
jgi:hypothetical protein